MISQVKKESCPTSPPALENCSHAGDSVSTMSIQDLHASRNYIGKGSATRKFDIARFVRGFCSPDDASQCSEDALEESEELEVEVDVPVVKESVAVLEKEVVPEPEVVPETEYTEDSVTVVADCNPVKENSSNTRPLIFMIILLAMLLLVATVMDQQIQKLTVQHPVNVSSHPIIAMSSTPMSRGKTFRRRIQKAFLAHRINNPNPWHPNTQDL